MTAWNSLSPRSNGAVYLPDLAEAFLKLSQDHVSLGLGDSGNQAAGALQGALPSLSASGVGGNWRLAIQAELAAEAAGPWLKFYEGPCAWYQILTRIGMKWN